MICRDATALTQAKAINWTRFGKFLHFSIKSNCLSCTISSPVQFSCAFKLDYGMKRENLVRNKLSVICFWYIILLWTSHATHKLCTCFQMIFQGSNKPLLSGQRSKTKAIPVIKLDAFYMETLFFRVLSKIQVSLWWIQQVSFLVSAKIPTFQAVKHFREQNLYLKALKKVWMNQTEDTTEAV